MTASGVVAIVGAVGLDLVFGEPRDRFHPVAWFGRVVAPVDRSFTSHNRALLAGAVVAFVLPLAAAGAVWLLVTSGTRIHDAVGLLLAVAVLASTTSLRLLLELTDEVVTATEDDLASARERVRGLVGRDTADLSAADVRSAAIESAAENLADGFVAPLLAFSLLAPASLALGAAVAAWVKAVNTLDSMLGYPDRPVGTASARLDDLVMWLPARLVAILVAVSGARSRGLLAARHDASEPASPNSGWPMATVAVVLGVRLEKPGAYVLNPAADRPTIEDGRRAVRVVATGGALAIVLALGLVLLDAPGLVWEHLLGGIPHSPSVVVG